MNKWKNKYIIGLTGSIGTGKSVVRRMLEHLGAYGIDADALAHRAMAKGAPGYDPILNTFGKFLLTEDGQIDRGRLGRIVFNDPQALAALEAIIHPLVLQAVDVLIRRSLHKVIVVEAIKLLETSLADMCDSIWLVYTPPEIQKMRLVQNRKMTEKEAWSRINSQAPQESRFNRANVIIKNVGAFDDTWQQVVTAWQRFVPTKPEGAFPVSKTVKLALGDVNVQRAGPRQVDEIVRVYNNVYEGKVTYTPKDVMAAFGEKAYLLLKVENNTMGFLGWQVENLVARTTEILLDPAIPAAEYLPILIREMEHASSQLQCEISLLFVPPHLSRYDPLWISLGYTEKKPAEMGVLAWQEAVNESMQPGSIVFFKKLRQDRVLRPI
ncbi:MAG TPA: dephospho-CoA kinase [Anaerolineaceae bacterium]|nr:dephospho-CoA kinase [Anaerolineaceae bacterium]